MQFTFSLLGRPISKGITKKEKGIYARIYSNDPKQYNLTIPEFAKWVGSFKSFTSAVYKDGDKRNSKNALGSHLIVLDFDEQSPLEGSPKLTIKNILSYLEGLELTPNIIYKSTSYTKEVQKFRVIWVFKEFIEAPQLSAFLKIMTDKVFSKKSPYMADSACKDLGRFFLGGFDAQVITNRPYQFEPFKEAIFNEYASQNESLTDSAFRKRKDRLIENYQKASKKGFSIYNTNRIPENGHFSDFSVPEELINSVKSTLQNEFNYEIACKQSPRFNDFDKGVGERLTYDEQFNLSLTLFKYKGGLEYMRSRLNLWNHNVRNGIGEHSEKREYDEGRERPFISRKRITYMYEYSSEPLTEWWDSELNESLTRISELGREFHRGIIVHTPVQTIPLDTGVFTLKTLMDGATTREGNTFKFLVNKLNEAFGKNTISYEEARDRIWVVRADTGLGKTENYLNVKGCVIALPTHKLKNEVINRMEKAGNKVYSIPETPRFQTPYFNQEIARLKKKKAYKKVSSFINDIAQKKITKQMGAIESLRALDSETAKLYITAKRTALNAPQDATIITTHQAAIHIGNGFKQKQIIFDENPRSALFNTQKFGHNDIYEMLGMLNVQTNLFENPQVPKGVQADLETLHRMLGRLSTYGNVAMDKERVVFRNKERLYDELVKHENGEAIIHFLESDVWQSFQQGNQLFYRGVERLRLPTDKQITILSATIEEWELDALDYKFCYFNIPHIENKGKISQDTKVSTSRQALRNPKNLEYITAKTQDAEYHITYKAMSDLFSNATEKVYVGNSAGYDELKGKRIALTGENRPNPVELELWLKLFNFEPQKDWDKFKMLNYKSKHFEYAFYGSEDENVNRIIHLFIQEDLAQRLGRARVIREEDAQVEMFNRTPSPYADEITDKEGKKHYPRGNSEDME